ncbi:MAG: DNA primase [Candidatus Sulfotelmatobacter sp.]
MPSTEDFKETVKQQADIVRIIGDYIKLKKAGAQNYSGLCPFHGEKTPSFSVHATRQFYHCFGCGVSGDVFSFVQKIENITFPEALRLVAQKLGIPLPKATYSSPAEAKEAKLRAQLFDAQERAAAFFQECLKRPDGSRAREYLQGRGLDEETIASFRIGYAPDSGFLLRDRLAAEFSEEVLRESGLFSWKTEDFDSSTAPEAGSKKPEARLYSKFRNRVMFPIASDAGKIIAFTGRTLATDEKSGPKYLNSPETGIYSKGRVLFNLDHAKEAIRKLDYAILVEGQMDCISVYAAGFHNVIASSGTAFTEIQAKLLGRFSKNVVVNFDPDTAGAKATERTLGLLIEEEFQVKVLSLEQGFDPDLYIRRKGRDAYGEALRGSQKYFDYLIDRARAHFPVRSAEGKVKAVNYLLPHIQRVPSRIVRDELSQEIAQKLGIDSTVLRQELRHVASERSAAAVKARPEAQATDAERILIRALASARQMQPGERLSARDGAEEEFDPARQAQYAFHSEGLHRGLATESLVEALLNAGPEIADVMEVPCSDGERRMLASILLKEDEELTAERLEGACRALRRIHLRRQQEQVQRELKKPGISDDKERMKELLLEVERLSRALRDPNLAEIGSRIGFGSQKTA